LSPEARGVIALREKIEQVKQAEREADEAIAAAREESARMVSEAERSARKVLEDAEADAASKATELLDGAAVEVEADADEIRKAADGEWSELEAGVAARVETAADWIVERLTR